MQLKPDALRWVMGQGVPTVVDVRGASMTPALRPGERVRVEPLSGDGQAIGAALAIGDIVLVITEDERELLLHRVVHLFEEEGRPFVVHQGDAVRSTFAVVPRASVLGRAVGFEREAGRTWPALEALDDEAARLFRRRARAASWFCGARRFAHAVGIGEGPLARGAARAYRTIARAISG